MNPDHPILRTGRALLARHEATGAVPLGELRVWFAELEATLSRPPSELTDLGKRTDLDRNPHGFPPEMRLA